VRVPKIKHDDFACRCTPKASAKAQAVLEWAYQHLSKGTTEMRPIQTDATNLLSHVVFTLEWNYRAMITMIPTDQWSAVATSTHDKKFSTYIQCDNVEDGLAYTLKAYYDKFGETVK
jgi:hypothetical protein